MEPVADFIDELFVVCYAWRHAILTVGVVGILGLFLGNLKSGWRTPPRVKMHHHRKPAKRKTQADIDREDLLHA